MGSPFLRWLRRLRPDPLRRLHLDPRPTGPTPTVRRIGTDRPRPDPRSRSRARCSAPGWTRRCARGRPRLRGPARTRGRTRCAAAARSRAADLSDALDRAVAGTDLGLTGKPVWWRVFGALQALCAAAAVAGGLWLAGLYALTVLRLPEPGTPMDRRRAAAHGAAARRAAGSGCCSRCRPGCWPGCARAGAAARAEARLRTAVAEVADELVRQPRSGPSWPPTRPCAPPWPGCARPR